MKQFKKILLVIFLCLSCIHPVYAMDEIPSYANSPYTVIDNNQPSFTSEELNPVSRTEFQSLDSLGRTQSAFAVIGLDSMPTEKRGSIGMIRPSGWHLVKYSCVDGRYLYNRCHLIGYQLCGVNADRRNLITGTRYMNVQGMLPFENQIADFVESTQYHVADRVTPIYDGNNLLASGVHIEAQSIEDNGSGLSLNVYCFNVQPGIIINYTNGDSSLENEDGSLEQEETSTDRSLTVSSADYILNTNTKKFHYSTCSSVRTISDRNRQEYSGSRDDLIARGYEPCKRCNP